MPLFAMSRRTMRSRTDKATSREQLLEQATALLPLVDYFGSSWPSNGSPFFCDHGDASCASIFLTSLEVKRMLQPELKGLKPGARLTISSGRRRSATAEDKPLCQLCPCQLSALRRDGPAAHCPPSRHHPSSVPKNSTARSICLSASS